MRFRSRALLLAVLPVVAGTPKPASETVVLFVEGQGYLPGPTWYGAQAATSWIFAEIGIRLIWRLGRVPADPAPGGIAIQVHIQGPLEPREKGCANRAAFACAWPYGDGTPRIVVLYDNIRYACEKVRLCPQLLSHTMAHEIAHILQTTELHSPEGIMKGHWTADDQHRMKYGPLRFTESDVDSIRRGIEYRHSRTRNH